VRRLVLASASPARRSLLESAGLAPEVIISDVDESGTEHLRPVEAVATLAERKGRRVAARLAAGDAHAATGTIIVACDSMLEFNGRAWGKAATAEEVIRRWKLMAGRQGRLHTGHWIGDTAGAREVSRVDTTTVHFGRPTEAQIEAYAGTEESRRVAGPFTMEGRSAPWVLGIEGNAGTVMGISVPVVTELLQELGIEITELWT
jgi:septum formation protein